MRMIISMQRLGIYKYGHERWLRSNLRTILSSWTQFLCICVLSINDSNLFSSIIFLTDKQSSYGEKQYDFVNHLILRFMLNILKWIIGCSYNRKFPRTPKSSLDQNEDGTRWHQQGGASGLSVQRAAERGHCFTWSASRTLLVCETFSPIWAEDDSSIKNVLFLTKPSSRLSSSKDFNTPSNLRPVMHQSKIAVETKCNSIKLAFLKIRSLKNK